MAATHPPGLRSRLPHSSCAHSLLAGLLALSFGCASSSTASTSPRDSHTRASLAAPGSHATLPDGASLRLALGEGGELGIVILLADRRIWGDLSLRPIDGPKVQAVHVEFHADALEKISADAQVISGGLVGSVAFGERHARWRVASEADGSLSGQRWSPALAQRCHALELAGDIVRELDEGVPELSSRARLSSTEQRELREQVRLAQLALDLGLRACEGQGRASLPTLTGPFAWR